MDRLLILGQFIVAIIMLLCIITLVIAHTLNGNINSIAGFLMSLLFIFLGWQLVRLPFREMRNELKK